MSTPSLRRAATAASAFLLVLPAHALAAPAADLGEKTPLNLPTEQTTQLDTVGGGGGNLVRTFVGLAIVIAVIYGLYWVLKQVKASKEERHSGSGLGTLATLPLGPNRSLHLVRAGSELVLVGVGEHGVTPIRTYAEAEARELGLLVDEPEVAVEAPAAEGGLARRPELGGVLGRAVSDLRARTVIR